MSRPPVGAISSYILSAASACHWKKKAEPGSAYRIFTGAEMPAGPDTVLMQEDCTVQGETVTILQGINRGANRRLAGEDIQIGSTILTRGKRLRPQEIGLAASVGRKSLVVYRPLRVALFSTGDEVLDLGNELMPGKIFDANRYSIAALLGQLGCIVNDLGILPDNNHIILESLQKSHNFVLTLLIHYTYFL